MIGLATAVTLLWATMAQENRCLKDLTELRGKEFRAESYIRAVIGLQSIGKVRGSQILLQFARKREYETEVIVLCRMLFRPKGADKFRRPMIGGPRFLGESKGLHYFDEPVIWPLEPIELVDGVPFFIVASYTLYGMAESAESYVECCMRRCAWNDMRFQTKSEQDKQKALDTLLMSPKWQGKLDESERAFLTSQIK